MLRRPPANSTEGLENARLIREEFPQTAIMILSAHVEVEHATRLPERPQAPHRILRIDRAAGADGARGVARVDLEPQPRRRRRASGPARNRVSAPGGVRSTVEPERDQRRRGDRRAARTVGHQAALTGQHPTLRRAVQTARSSRPPGESGPAWRGTPARCWRG